ncbi:unnamed protein product [Gulo gulo]|uniref:Uncharacterized protein n=1 Tax=Gulo gulo TaxID=48420 RepID=A0A9X9LCZ6_GULGU|nr:unnamed protein product [Gulo gulo]
MAALQVQMGSQRAITKKHPGSAPHWVTMRKRKRSSAKLHSQNSTSLLGSQSHGLGLPIYDSMFQV